MLFNGSWTIIAIWIHVGSALVPRAWRSTIPSHWNSVSQSSYIMSRQQSPASVADHGGSPLVTKGCPEWHPARRTPARWNWDGCCWFRAPMPCGGCCYGPVAAPGRVQGWGGPGGLGNRQFGWWLMVDGYGFKRVKQLVMLDGYWHNLIPGGPCDSGRKTAPNMGGSSHIQQFQRRVTRANDWDLSMIVWKLVVSQTLSSHLLG